MENKYFTPDIEDICIGYELEMNWNRAYEEKWVPVKISIQDEEFACTDEISEIVNALDDGMSEARVPYLTKEQIEAEGWNFETVLFEDDNENDVYSDGFAKHADSYHWYEMVLRKDNKIHIVYKWYRNSVGQTWRDVYYGECKDINTFRKIIKLLGI